MPKASGTYWTLLVDGIPQGKLNRTLLSTVLRQPVPNLLAGEDFPDLGEYDMEGRHVVIVRIRDGRKPAMLIA